jgi:hypothetical protein
MLATLLLETGTRSMLRSHGFLDRFYQFWERFHSARDVKLVPYFQGGDGEAKPVRFWVLAAN